MSYLKLVCSIIPRHIFASASEHGVTWYKYFDCILNFLSSILSLHNWVQRQEKNIPVIVYHSCLDCFYCMRYTRVCCPKIYQKCILHCILHHWAIPQDMSQGSKIASARQWFTVWSMVCTICFKLPCLNKNLNEIFLRGLIQRFPLSYIYKKKQLLIKWFIHCLVL